MMVGLHDLRDLSNHNDSIIPYDSSLTVFCSMRSNYLLSIDVLRLSLSRAWVTMDGLCHRAAGRGTSVHLQPGASPTAGICSHLLVASSLLGQHSMGAHLLASLPP